MAVACIHELDVSACISQVCVCVVIHAAIFMYLSDTCSYWQAVLDNCIYLITRYIYKQKAGHKAIFCYISQTLLRVYFEPSCFYLLIIVCAFQLFVPLIEILLSGARQTVLYINIYIYIYI